MLIVVYFSLICTKTYHKQKKVVCFLCFSEKYTTVKNVP